MRSRASSTFACLAALGLGVAVFGCQKDSPPQTVGEKMEVQGKIARDAGIERQKGEDMLAEGNGKLAQGQQLIKLGKVDEGKAMAAAGEAQIARAQDMIRQANQKRDNALRMPVSTQPMMPMTNPLP